MLGSWALGNRLGCFPHTYCSTQQELQTGDVASVFSNFSLDFIVVGQSHYESRCVINKPLRIHHGPLGTQVSYELPTGLSHCAALDVCIKNTLIFVVCGLCPPAQSRVILAQRLARVCFTAAALLVCGRTSDF